MLDQLHSSNARATSHATGTDFLSTFTEEMDSLYLLSLLLTADKVKAEQCFIQAMGDCVDGIGVFKGWTSSWTRQAVLKTAIRMIMPVPENMNSSTFHGFKDAAPSAGDSPFAAILSLNTFERFVFVISVLEGRTELECTILLRCSRRDVAIARALAIKLLARSDAADPQADDFMQA